jgi:hypothetical protein
VKTLLRFFRPAAYGFGITVWLVIYQVAADSLRLKPLPPVVALVVFLACPPALLSVPLIDLEPGTGLFYFIWLLIAMFNGALYAVIGMAITRLLHADPPAKY